jgi:hypothetical protein
VSSNPSTAKEQKKTLLMAFECVDPASPGPDLMSYRWLAMSTWVSHRQLPLQTCLPHLSSLWRSPVPCNIVRPIHQQIQCALPLKCVKNLTTFTDAWRTEYCWS